MRVEIEVLSRQLQEMEQARLRDKEDMEKKQPALEAKLEHLLGLP
jgi:DNA-binding HxlR family transcriptional regulator